jgi:hypothetical protein
MNAGGEEGNIACNVWSNATIESFEQARVDLNAVFLRSDSRRVRSTSTTIGRQRSAARVLLPIGRPSGL